MDEEQYILCTQCGDEFTDDELGDLEVYNTWQSNVCLDCQSSYKCRLEVRLAEAEEQFAEEWADEADNFHG